MFADPSGYDNIVVIVGMPGDAGGTFEKTADTYKKEHANDTVTIVYAKNYKNVSSLVSGVNSAFGSKGVDSMVYFGHSYEGGLSVFYHATNPPPNDNRWIDENTDWSAVKFNKGSTIYLFGCNGGTGEDNSIAQILANQTGSTAYGYTSYSFFTNDSKLGNMQRQPKNSDVNKSKFKGKDLWLVPVNGKPMTKFTQKVKPSPTPPPKSGGSWTDWGFWPWNWFN